VLALSTALAASIVASVARRSSDVWDDAMRVSSNADGLRRQATHLVTANAAAYSDAIDAIGRAAEAGGGHSESFDKTLETAANSPLRIGAIAAEVSVLAADCTANAVEDARADAKAARLLAESCAAAAAILVTANQVVPEDHPSAVQAREQAERAKS
jgi:formiminotetrahydrofolate cyclodeaminase